MINKYYIEEDDILSDMTISDLNDVHPTTTLSQDSDFTVAFESLYPTHSDITGDSSAIKSADYFEIVEDSTALLKIPFINDVIKMECDELSDSENRYKILDFDFTIFGNCDTWDECVWKYESTEDEGLIIYDYVKDSTGTITYYTDKFVALNRTEIVSNYDSTDLPQYVFECHDGTTTIYYKPQLVDLGVPKPLPSSPIYYDFTDSDSTIIDGMWTNITTLPMIFKLEKFRNIIKNTLSGYDSVDLVLKIVNPHATVKSKIFKDDLFLKWTRTVKIYFDLTLNNIDLLTSNTNQFLNRGMYFRLNSSDLLNFYNGENLEFKLNEMIMSDVYDVVTDYFLLETENKIEINNNESYYPLEIYNDGSTANVFSCKISNLKTDKLFFINDTSKATLMRYNNDTYLDYMSYLPENVEIKNDESYYLVASERTDITNSETELIGLVSQVFYSDVKKLISVYSYDITNVFDSIDEELKIQLYWNSVNENETMINIKLSKGETVHHLKKFIDVGLFDIVLQNTLLSVSYLNRRNHKIYKKLIYLKDIESVTSYGDGTSTINIYKITDLNIINVYGILNSNIIESAKVEDVDEYYVPSDVILIKENYKLN